jgi:hypothetical protein
MSLDLDLALGQPQLVGALLLTLLGIKALVLYLVARFGAREDNVQSLALAALLAQGGEFAFVVFGLAASNALISAEQRNLAILVITLSMAATPLLVRLRAEVTPASKARPPREFDTFDAATPRVIIAGMGRVGQIVARMLNANRIPFTALESDPEQVDFMRHFGNTVFYGDASRLDLLRAAQTGKAEVFADSIRPTSAWGPTTFTEGGSTVTRNSSGTDPSKTTHHQRATANAPTVTIAPESRTHTGVGATASASAVQKWNGTRAIFTSTPVSSRAHETTTR